MGQKPTRVHALRKDRNKPNSIQRSSWFESQFLGQSTSCRSFHRTLAYLAEDGFVSETIEVGRAGSPAKRVHRTAEEKRRIVEATLVPGASIARVAREHGVNANQVFQWRHEYRKGASWAGKQSRPRLLPVTVAAEPSSSMAPEVKPVAAPSGCIHIELPGRALVSAESGVAPDLLRAVLESLSR
jgi:transposase